MRAKFLHLSNIFSAYQHCEIFHKGPYNIWFGDEEVIEKSLVLIHEKLWEPCRRWHYLKIAIPIFRLVLQNFDIPGYFA